MKSDDQPFFLALARARAGPAVFGNMSSATVLFVLDAVLPSKVPRPGDWGVLTALGPGFAAEGILLRW
ncbi:MAG: 3-oxoacyl-[acyl-carrier-protein] synthase III C-terminal domain-containing protein [Candidatus Methylomirabilales bacterium]